MAKRVTKKVEEKIDNTKSNVVKEKATVTKGRPKKVINNSTPELPVKKVDKPIVKKSTTKKAPVKKTDAPLTALDIVKSMSEIDSTRKKPLKNKESEKKFIRISSDSKTEEFNKMGQMIQRGEIQWSYYAIDGNVAYHYYLKLK